MRIINIKLRKKGCRDFDGAIQELLNRNLGLCDNQCEVTEKGNNDLTEKFINVCMSHCVDSLFASNSVTGCHL